MAEKCLRKEGLLMLDFQYKEHVLEIVDEWRKSEKIYSVRDKNKKISKSTISPIIDIYEYSLENVNNEEREKFLRKHLQTLSTSNAIIINGNERKDLIKFIKDFLNDKKVMALTHEQQLFMLQWLRRLL